MYYYKERRHVIRIDGAISANLSTSNPGKSYVCGKQSGQSIYLRNLRSQNIYKRLKYLPSNHRHVPLTQKHLYHFLEFSIHFRERVVWASFHKYKSILLDHKKSLYLRFKYLDACVDPALLFGITLFSSSRFQIQKMDILQKEDVATNRWMASKWGRRLEYHIDSNEWTTCSRIQSSFLSSMVDIFCKKSMEIYTASHWLPSTILGTNDD